MVWLALTRAPKKHINRRILQNSISGIPFVLGLRAGLASGRSRLGLKIGFGLALSDLWLLEAGLGLVEVQGGYKAGLGLVSGR